MDSEVLSISWDKHENALVRTFEELFMTNTFVDCTLAAEGQYMKAHKLVLSACSPYFELLFRQECEKNPIVVLKDIKFNDLKVLVKFIYRGKADIPRSEFSRIVEAAESLQIKGLSAQAAAKAAEQTANKTDSECEERSSPCPRKRRRRHSRSSCDEVNTRVVPPDSDLNDENSSEFPPVTCEVQMVESPAPSSVPTPRIPKSSVSSTPSTSSNIPKAPHARLTTEKAVESGSLSSRRLSSKEVLPESIPDALHCETTIKIEPDPEPEPEPEPQQEPLSEIFLSEPKREEYVDDMAMLDSGDAPSAAADQSAQQNSNQYPGAFPPLLDTLDDSWDLQCGGQGTAANAGAAAAPRSRRMVMVRRLPQDQTQLYITGSSNNSLSGAGGAPLPHQLNACFPTNSATANLGRSVAKGAQIPWNQDTISTCVRLWDAGEGSRKSTHSNSVMGRSLDQRIYDLSSSGRLREALTVNSLSNVVFVDLSSCGDVARKENFRNADADEISITQHNVADRPATFEEASQDSTRNTVSSVISHKDAEAVNIPSDKALSDRDLNRASSELMRRLATNDNSETDSEGALGISWDIPIRHSSVSEVGTNKLPVDVGNSSASSATVSRGGENCDDSFKTQNASTSNALSRSAPQSEPEFIDLCVDDTADDSGSARDVSEPTFHQVIIPMVTFENIDCSTDTVTRNLSRAFLPENHAASRFDSSTSRVDARSTYISSESAFHGKESCDGFSKTISQDAATSNAASPSTLLHRTSETVLANSEATLLETVGDQSASVLSTSVPSGKASKNSGAEESGIGSVPNTTFQASQDGQDSYDTEHQDIAADDPNVATKPNLRSSGMLRAVRARRASSTSETSKKSQIVTRTSRRQEAIARANKVALRGVHSSTSRVLAEASEQNVLEKPPSFPNIYRCTECNKSFRYRSLLSYHMMIHTGGRVYQCPHCEAVFRYAGRFFNHMRDKHNTSPDAPVNVYLKTPVLPQGSYSQTQPGTEDVGASFGGMGTEQVTAASLDVPNAVASAGATANTSNNTRGAIPGRYKCRLCRKPFRYRFKFRQHMRAHRGKGELPLACQYCDERFLYGWDLWRHRKVKHRNLISATKKITKRKSPSTTQELVQDTRAASVFSKGILVKQEPSTTPMLETDEGVSSMASDRNTGLKTVLVAGEGSTWHVREDNEAPSTKARNVPKTHQCNQCNRKFPLYSSLMVHVQSHSNERPYKCRYCDKTYKFSWKVLQHTRNVHPGKSASTRKFLTVNKIEPEIQEQDATLSQLLHTTSATSESVSPAMAADIPSSSGIKTTDAVNEVIPPPKTIRRPGAGKPYPSVRVSRKKAAKMYKCSMCSRTFRYPQFLAEHFSVHTGARPYACEHCGTTFRYQRDLYKHVQDRHSETLPFHCNVCLKGFPTLKVMKTHRRRMHGIS